ncbi:MAG: redoxin domain-containing protein [Pirellulaceae bacterium]|nr:redoxin domain-containing protein [Pirellulaceae bacterium]
MMRRNAKQKICPLLVIGFSFLGFTHASRGQQVSEAPIRQGPRLLVPGDHGIGRYIAEVSGLDVTGKTWKLSDLGQNRVVVIAMTSTSCPLSKKYLPTLLELAKSNRSREMTLLLVNPVAADSADEMKSIAADLDSNTVYIWDKDQTLARAVGAVTTTDVFVLDPSRTVAYHGAIDDQYGFGYSLDAPRHRYLAEALAAVLDERPPVIAATEAPGCTLDLEPITAGTTSITYHNRISRIIQRHCVECHRDGGVAPFSLETFDDVAGHAPMIRQVVERGIMPPWFAAPPAPNQPSPWANDRSLAETEKQDLFAWIAGGQIQGDELDAPQPRTFPDGWLIGKPDAIFQMPRALPVKADGTMPYQYVTVETNLEEDRWVQAMEVRPGTRDVVHHILVFDVRPGEKDQFRGGTNGFFAAYVPGNGTLVYPPGYARRLRKGSQLVFQLHYTPSGKATEDRSQLGLIFAPVAPRHEVRVTGLANPKLQIPPHAHNYADHAQIRVPADVQLLSLMPHMHLRGKACRYETVSADGTVATLLDVPRYDFNWQLPYRFAEPPMLRAGTTVKFTAWYDNSDQNPANPDPAQTVRWGEQTFDEMLLGYVEYVVPGKSPGESRR